MCLNIFLKESSSGRFSLLFDPAKYIPFLQWSSYVYLGELIHIP